MRHMFGFDQKSDSIQPFIILSKMEYLETRNLS